MSVCRMTRGAGGSLRGSASVERIGDRVTSGSDRLHDQRLVAAVGGIAGVVGFGFGDGDVFAAGGQTARLYRMRRDGAEDVTTASGIGAALPSGAVSARFGDYDNDGWLDLFAVRTDGRAVLLRNGGTGSFQSVAGGTGGLATVTGARGGVFVDADHDGEAAASRMAYRSLTATEKAQVVAFLQSLGQAEFDWERDHDVDEFDWFFIEQTFTGPGSFLSPDDFASISDVDADVTGMSRMPGISVAHCGGEQVA